MVSFLFPGMNVVTCLQALDIFPLARQALICTYFCYHSSDYDTFRTSCLIIWTITVLHFNVSSLQNACELSISIVPRDGSHLQPFVRWQTYLCYFLIVCYNTQAMPIFRVLNFLFVTLLNPRWFKWPQYIWKIWGPQPQSVHVIHPFKRTSKNNMQKFILCVD